MNKSHSKVRINVQALRQEQEELGEADKRASQELTPEEHNDLAELYLRHQRLDRALAQSKKALARAKPTSNAPQTMRAWAGMATVLQQQGRTEQAVDCRKEALQAAQVIGNRKEEAAQLNELGEAHSLAGHFRAAIQNHTDARQLYREAGMDMAHSDGLATSLRGMGLAHYKLGEYKKAMELFQELAEFLAGVPEEAGYWLLATSKMALGGCCFRLEQYSAAVEHLGRALTLTEAHQEDHMVLEACLAIGNCHLSLRQPQTALELFQRALDLAEGSKDARNQCRALCGAGLCYYVGGEANGAAKLFQNALACDTRVASTGAGLSPSIGDQVVDEQLLVLLHDSLREHAPTAQTRDLMGTMYLGLTAVTMNGGGVLTPSSLPHGLVDTVVESLTVSAQVVEMNAVFARYTPYLQHYCMHILQQLVHQRNLRHMMLHQGAVNAVLACMAFPMDLIPGGSSIQSHTAACKLLRGLLNCPPPTSSRDEVGELFLRSPQLEAVLDLLPRRAKLTSDARLKQAVDILTSLSALMAVVPTTTNTASSSGSRAALSPSQLSRQGQGPGKSFVAAPQDSSSIMIVICEVVRVAMDGDAYSEADLQLLEPCLRALVSGCKRSNSIRVLVFRKLEASRLERLSNCTGIPSTSALLGLAVDLCRMLRDYSDSRLNGSFTGVRSEDLTTTLDDNTTHDQDTTFDSLSSHSSLQNSGLRHTISVHRLPVGGAGDELLTGGEENEDTAGLDDVSWVDEYVNGT
eukprot:GGOE01042915.1.p1 GENE.GGOE01042915.1~~GGOE01042915.1.p1  ORF type:complete len:778 (-),score=241.89 GGOE01042915.1:42-2285(-)